MPVTLLQAIAFCFEKVEIIDGWSFRWLPFFTEKKARASFDTWLAELTRWKGPPESTQVRVDERQARWRDIRMRQAGRGIVLWIRPGHVLRVWSSKNVWNGNAVERAFNWRVHDESAKE